MKRNLLVFSLFLFALSFANCNNLYRAGNLIALSYPVETNLRTELVMRYVDTLIRNYGYSVPDRWAHYDKLVGQKRT